MPCHGFCANVILNKLGLLCLSKHVHRHLSNYDMKQGLQHTEQQSFKIQNEKPSTTQLAYSMLIVLVQNYILGYFYYYLFYK